MQPQFSIKFVGDKLQDGKVLYKMQIYDTSSKVTWIVEARFSHLRDIHKALQLRFPKGQLPDFPPKGWWYQNQKPEFITKRKKQLQNYYNTLFKTSSVNNLPQLKQFIESERPAALPQPKSKQPATQSKQNLEKPPSVSNASPMAKHDQFHDVYEKTAQKFINLRNEDIEPPNDNETKKKKAEFQKVKIEGKSTIIQGMKLPKSKVENYVEFWSSAYFEEKKENHQAFLREIKNFDMGFEESRKSVAHNIVNRVVIIEE